MSWSVSEQSPSVSPFSPPSQANVHTAGAGLGASGGASGSHQAGPFSPQVNAFLSQSFGQSLSDISVTRGEGAKNQKISAEAHTIGRHISLGDHIKEDPSDAHSMEVIAHEVSHALARGGSGQHIINQAGDPGQHAAYDAGRQFKSFMSSGAKGAAPQLKPAHGGRATIHRFEGGEHKNAVDGAVELLGMKPPGGRPAVTVDPQVAQLMTSEITLGNGLRVKPGDLTAMMGDFYGVYNKDGSFNPQKSFENMNRPDNKAEMEIILAKIGDEEKSVKSALNHTGKFQATTAKELEELTLNRHKQKDKDGAVSGLSMLELAERNNAHFSAKNPNGTDNNMGAYESFHQLALKAAQDGDKNLARAYEASGMHFLTDRHAGGHQFEKAGVQNAYKEGGAINPLLKMASPIVAGYDAARNSDTLSQGATHIVHDHFNKTGVDVANKTDAPWLAKGDKHWADDDNAENRFQTAKSVYTSYSELNSVLTRRQTPEEVERKGYGARETVPQFDDKNQKAAEDMARKLSVGEVVSEEKENLNLIGPLAKRKWVNIKNKVGDTWQGAKDLGGQAVDWGKDRLHDAKELGGQAVDWGKDRLHDAKELGGQAVDWGKTKISNGWEGTKDVANKGKEAVSSGWGWLKKKVGF